MIKDCPMCKGLTVIGFTEYPHHFTIYCPNCQGEGYVEDIGDNEESEDDDREYY